MWLGKPRIIRDAVHKAAELHPTARQEQGTQDTAINLSNCTMDGLIGIILRGKGYAKLCRLNNLLKMLNPSQELLCERKEV